jgi:hypothetical protein
MHTGVLVHKEAMLVEERRVSAGIVKGDFWMVAAIPVPFV